MKLKDKIIIVTGGDGLLGKEIISNAKKEGAFCINIDINHISAEDLSYLNADVTDEDSVRNSVELVINRYGRIDGLVNNAYPRTKDWGFKVEDVKFDSWRNNVDWQLNSCFLLSQIVAFQMAKQQYGSIVNMASIYGIVGPDFSIYENSDLTMPVAYSAIKGGVVNLSKYLASYLGKDKVRVNAVSPGGIFNGQPDEFVSRYEKKTPLRRMGNPQDIAPSVIFLLSDEASYITGHNLIIDGGWTCI